MQISLVVNVASECGYTDQNYRELVSLQEDYHSSGFTVLAFPCNQFGGQEPASNDEILKFAKDKYNVNFPMFAKVDVKGEEISKVYEYLTSAVLNTPTWNFCKYLVDRNGEIVQFFKERDSFVNIRQSLDYMISRTHTEL
jgi:glutathione peroxidase